MNGEYSLTLFSDYFERFTERVFELFRYKEGSLVENLSEDSSLTYM